MDTRYYQTGGFTIEVNSDLNFRPDCYLPKFEHFEVQGPGTDLIRINHFFNKKYTQPLNPENKIYDIDPWAVYTIQDQLVYKYCYNKRQDETDFRMMVTNRSHAEIDIYHNEESTEQFLTRSQSTLTLFPNDQIFLCQLLSQNQGCVFHSTGIILENKGYLFVGHSDEGKSTIAKIMSQSATVLCDDRNIVRKTDSGYTLFGTWYHSDFPQVSSRSAPLKAIFFLDQAKENKIEPVEDGQRRFKHLIGRVIKPMATHAWWEATIDTIEGLSKTVDCLNLRFDKSQKISEIIANYYK